MRWFDQASKEMPPRAVWLSSQVLLRSGPPTSARLNPLWRVRQVSPTVELLGFSDTSQAGSARRALGIDASARLTEEDLAWIREAGGAGLLPFFQQALGWPLPAVEAMELGETLRQIRDGLRASRPSPVAGGLPMLCVDLVARAGARMFYVRGWWRNGRGRMVRLTALTPEGAAVEIGPLMTMVPRPDIAAKFVGDGYNGFLSSFELPHPSLLGEDWRMEMETADGFVCEAPAPGVVSDAEAALDAVLPDLGLDAPRSTPAIALQVDRFVSAVLAHRRAGTCIAREVPFGSLASPPQVTAVVPLHGRIDLIEHQLAQFALDPEWQRVELVYVLDSPEATDNLLWRAEALHRLYGIAFRVVVLNQSAGYAVANNLAVRTATSDRLLLLNSDVIPDRPGWLGQMMATYEQQPKMGALGPKLLFEDDSIQHAGLEYAAASDGFGWDTFPCCKGMHRHFHAANQAGVVSAVTGACLMVDRQLFFDAGGFDEGYVQGDYEDMDLCLRLAAMGRKNWYDPNIELYHLEGVSYSNARRMRNSAYNRWRHSKLWGKAIRKIVKSF